MHTLFTYLFSYGPFAFLKVHLGASFFFQQKHEEEMAEVRNKWEKLLAGVQLTYYKILLAIFSILRAAFLVPVWLETAAKNKAEMQQLQQEQDNTMKSVNCEQEMLWNGHYANLTEDFNAYLRDAREAVIKLNNETKKEAKALEVFNLIHLKNILLIPERNACRSTTNTLISDAWFRLAASHWWIMLSI